MHSSKSAEYYVKNENPRNNPKDPPTDPIKSVPFMELFLLFPLLGSVSGSVHRTTSSAEPLNLTEPVVLPNLPNRTERSV